jgi:hypothetical protein
MMQAIMKPETYVGHCANYNEKLHTSYASPNIIRVIKSRSMRWVGHAASMGETRNAHKISVGKTEGERILEDLGVDGRVILEWTLGKYGGKV